MALKGPRVVLETDITFTCPTATLRGVVLCNKTGGSGVVLGDSAGVADLMASASGNTPVGLLMNDIVNVDLTRYHINFQKDEVPVNYRVTLLRKGRVTTDALVSGQSPTYGQTAYLSANGQVTPTVSSTGGVAATPKVGTFLGAKDENGFVTVDFNIPQI